MNEFVDLPNVKLDMERFKSEEYFPMNKREWKRLRTKVAGLSRKRRDFAAVGWGFIGVAATALFTGVTWGPAYRAMSDELRFEFSWVWPAVAAAGLGSIVIAFIAFTASHLFGKAEIASAEEIVDEMDGIFDLDESAFKTANGTDTAAI